jgi:hypothetical protein
VNNYKVAHVFVSSTSLDLQCERRAVEEAIQGLWETKYLGMEYFGSRDETTLRASLDEVRRSQVYVGIIGGRYGSGITEEDYRCARELSLPIFIYFKDELTIPPEGREMDDEGKRRLTEFKDELRRKHSVALSFKFTWPALTSRLSIHVSLHLTGPRRR